MTEPSPVADHADRNAVRLERTRNVIVDAGAGTGKTTLLVDRMVELVAPADDANPALELQRMAAITFTRRAAGELKLRLRARLFEELEQPDQSTVRRSRLDAARAALDNAYLGTVHSFADRLLRLLPSSAGLSPDYEIAEDTDALVVELLDRLFETVSDGSLETQLTQPEAVSRALEATSTVHDFLRAGLLKETKAFEFYAHLGFDQLVRDMLNTRDRPLQEPPSTAPNMAAVTRLVDEASRLGEGISGNTDGGLHFTRALGQLEPLRQSTDPVSALRLYIHWKLSHLPTLKQRECKPGELAAWEGYKWLTKGERGRGAKKEERGSSVLEDLDREVFGWMARRLVRLRPVLVDLYEQVKVRHQVVDQLDLLLKLRDVMRDNREARRSLQERFEHVLVDEFQDTDPLQAEIVLYLCEDGATAGRPDQVVTRPGSLTVVGDPKQSIYRFRRADVAMYDQVCRTLRAQDVLQAELRVNFRSRPDMLHWLDGGLRKLLGESATGDRFDAKTGQVYYRPLSPGREVADTPNVHVLPYGDDVKGAPNFRWLEGQALALHLRQLVESRQFHIPTPEGSRLLRYGDCAVLAITTPHLGLLTTRLDALKIPHVVRGGTLFLNDPLHKQLLLAISAIANQADGAGRAALERSPFFAVDFRALLAARFGTEEPDVVLMRERIHAIRRARFQRPIAQTLRALVEETGFARRVATLPNGPQRLARLDELVHRLALLAQAENLDFDALATRARSWVDRPVALEAPLPLDVDAVQILTVHQAKGLEWPVVALWDGVGGEETFLPDSGLFIDSRNGDWAVKLRGLEYDTRGTKVLANEEKAFRRQERCRVAYVAATRARELLIVPEAGGGPRDTWLYGRLIGHATTSGAHRLAPFAPEDTHPDSWWNQTHQVSLHAPPPLDTPALKAWPEYASATCKPKFAPGGVSSVAQLLRQSLQSQPDEQAEAPTPAKVRKGRYGTTFGSTVHGALESILQGVETDVQKAVSAAAKCEGLTSHHPQALEDVLRALATLEAANLRYDSELRCEYSLAGMLPGSQETLLLGYIDLLVQKGSDLHVIDFKTDQPPQGTASQSHRHYLQQVRAYMALLQTAGAVPAGGRLKGALLFTADGSFHSV